MKRAMPIAICIVIAMLFFIGCDDSDSTSSLNDNAPADDPAEVVDAVADPTFDAATMSPTVDNIYFPLTPGTSWVYESPSKQRQGGETEERVEIFVSHQTREVAGVECTVVVDRVYESGDLIEETFDWYAQDADGNVWYMGEDSKEYEHGELVGTEGSWEAGVDGAQAGIIMKADLTVGDRYRQEYYEGEAEDMAEIFALNVSVTLSDGATYTCVQIKEWDPLEPGVIEYKYFAPNIGMVLEEKEDGSETFELKDTAMDVFPKIEPENFVDAVDNPYFPLTPGMVYTYEGATEEGTETVVLYVTGDTREVMGVTCVVVRDREYLDGELVEETFDWYAQDRDGNVWYFGEASSEYEDGEMISTEGSWEAGVDGAQPGIIMEGDPRVGDTYRQEYYKGEAEDKGAVVALKQSVTVPYGVFHNCLKTRDWNPLEPDSVEYKYYAPGIGLILEEKPETEEQIELFQIEPFEETPALEEAKLLIEHNAADEDTGFQGFADGEPWNELAITGPIGEQILFVYLSGGLRDFGLTELFFETSEPENAEVPIDDVLARLPEGTYTFTGDIVEEEESSVTTTFSHHIPDGPVLVKPTDEASDLNPDNVVISWQSVTKDINGFDIDIVGYQVIVEKIAEIEFPLGFVRPVFSVYLPAEATSITVPQTFMEDDACYEYEVLAIEISGNQTISAAEFETGEGCDFEEPPEDDTPKMKEAKLLIEHNATDEDTGFQGFADGDPWNELTISGSEGQPILTAKPDPEGGLFNFGLTEFFFETSEPENAEVSIQTVLDRLPEGTYSFTGDMVDSDQSIITTTFTHRIPVGPELLTPANGSTGVDPDNLLISWNPVTQDINGSSINIVGYQVIVEVDEESQHPQGFAHPVFSVYLPPTKTSVEVPAEFMERDTDYQYEVLAIEESGNQTLSSAEFTTDVSAD